MPLFSRARYLSKLSFASMWFSPPLYFLAMNLIKLLIISAVTVPAEVSAVQAHAASDIQTVRNLEKMKTLADKVKSLISRYKV